MRKRLFVNSIIVNMGYISSITPANASQKVGRNVIDDRVTTKGRRDLTDGVNAVCAKTNVPCPQIVLDDRTGTPIEADKDRGIISPDIFGLVRSRPEGLALAGLLVAWFNRRDVQPVSRNSDLPRQLLAIGALGIGETLDPLRDQADRNLRLSNFQYAGTDTPRPTSLVASTALTLASAVGGCSGAFADLMKRARTLGAEPSLERRRLAALATSLLRQLGSTVLPPDDTCVVK